MSKLVNGYLAIFREVSIQGEIRGDKSDANIGSRGDLTVWESENLHPGEKYIRFKPDDGNMILQTSCGAITIENDVFTICTQNGENKYSFELLKHIQTIDYRMKLPEKYWHICSGCGKRKILSSKEAFDEGWDYPGPDGIYKYLPNFGFGIFAPRTCGDCGIEKSLYWKLTVDSENRSNGMRDEEMQKTLERILDEPMSLFEEETMKE